MGGQPATFQWGWVCLATSNKMLGETLVPVSQPLPDVTELPDKGFPWQEEMGGQPEVHLTAPTPARRSSSRPTTDGGIQAIAGLIEAVRDRLNGGQHDGKVVADRAAGKGLLPASAVREDLDAAADDRRIGCRLDGPAPAPAASPPPSPPPSRRAAASPPRRLTPMRT